MPRRSATSAAKQVAHSEGRSALVDATITALAKDGPAQVHTNAICLELGLAKSLVNFHFGGRDGLLAEATATAHERYVGELVSGIDRQDDPIDRLTDWVDRMVSWQIENPGLANAFAFPDQVPGLQPGVESDASRRLSESRSEFEAALERLIRAALEEADTSGREDLIDAIDWLATGRAVRSVEPTPRRPKANRGTNTSSSRVAIERLLGLER